MSWLGVGGGGGGYGEEQSHSAGLAELQPAPRDIDSSRPMAQAGHIAVQVPGKEELGHPGLSQGKGPLPPYPCSR